MSTPTRTRDDIKNGWGTTGSTITAGETIHAANINGLVDNAKWVNEGIDSIITNSGGNEWTIVNSDGTSDTVVLPSYVHYVTDNGDGSLAFYDIDNNLLLQTPQYAVEADVLNQYSIFENRFTAIESDITAEAQVRSDEDIILQQQIDSLNTILNNLNITTRHAFVNGDFGSCFTDGTYTTYSQEVANQMGSDQPENGDIIFIIDANNILQAQWVKSTGWKEILNNISTDHVNDPGPFENLSIASGTQYEVNQAIDVKLGDIPRRWEFNTRAWQPGGDVLSFPFKDGKLNFILDKLGLSNTYLPYLENVSDQSNVTLRVIAESFSEDGVNPQIKNYTLINFDPGTTTGRLEYDAIGLGYSTSNRGLTMYRATVKLNDSSGPESIYGILALCGGATTAPDSLDQNMTVIIEEIYLRS
ncbi:hypothetical protein GQR36_25180 [Enterococcus termitis]